MPRPLVASVLSGLSLALVPVSLSFAGGEHCRMQSPEGLIAHEWGAFTSFSGSDGKLLRFSTNVVEGVPSFVFSRSKQDDQPRQLKTTFSTLQRMETPAIYFYAPEPMALNVRVDFPQGLLTEFYPPVSNIGPAPGKELDTAPTNGMLEWRNLRVLGHNARVSLPKIEATSHYAAAREAREAHAVQFSHNGEMHTERFLFYRGLGDFEPPIRAEALGNDRFRFTTTQKSQWPCVFLVSAKDGQVRWSVQDNVTGSHEFRLISATRNKDMGVERLISELREAGLFEPEARAMVNTWRDQWFAEHGTRFLAIMPADVVDSTLPLRIEPKPIETKRVFVARLEILTPELERQIESVMSTGDAGHEATWTRLREHFGWMGRFLPPAVDRVEALTPNIARIERPRAK